MLFSLTPKPIDPLTAPFIFDHVDTAVHNFPDESYIIGSMVLTGNGWSWGGLHRFIRPDVPEEIEWAEERSQGIAPTKAEALAACVAWMRGRL